MSLIGDVRSKIAAGASAAQSAVKACGHAHDELDDAIGHLSAAVADSGHPQAREALARMVEARDRLDEAMGLATSARSTALDYAKLI